ATGVVKDNRSPAIVRSIRHQKRAIVTEAVCRGVVGSAVSHTAHDDAVAHADIVAVSGHEWLGVGVRSCLGPDAVYTHPVPDIEQTHSVRELSLGTEPPL